LKILCRINENDEYESKFDFDVNINDNKEFTYTFFKKLDSVPKNTALDIFYISLFVFWADRRISRRFSANNWCRNITLEIPILEFENINTLKSQIEEMVSFLTGDLWHFNFRKRELSKNEEKIFEGLRENDDEKRQVENVCMLSGGLDSFIGAIDLLEESQDILFISHYGGGKGTHEYQEYIKDLFMQKYEIEEEQFYSFYAAAHKGVEDTTRSRSFMFFAHALAIASSNNGVKKLIIPENGLISLNIPLSYSRVGSSSTRTTHPHYMKMFQEIIKSLGLEIEFFNPYQFKTKGEMIIECKDNEFLVNNIDKSMSCSHPDIGRMKGEVEAQHCGNCLPCVIRRAAINKAINQDPTKYRDPEFSFGKTVKTNLNSYLLGISRFDKKKAFLDIQKSGPIVDCIKDYTGVYTRGMKEVSDLLGQYRNE
jgi:7-cyano-7-deazaguanine synthase in queuosine biosynthesis